ncbi:MAG TPA: PilZ domain-containing protein [Kofleriaceae bacterium]|nr:PilZ domain-containing protein [Kofleriaceae bacterium]
MLRIVTSNNGEVFRHLGSAPFRRLEVEQHTATTGAAITELVRRLRPDLVLLDAAMGDRESGFDVCRALKDDPELARTHVILLLAQRISRAELDGIERSRCDDVLSLPIHSDDFFHHIAQLCGLPSRRSPRVAVVLETKLLDGVESLRGTVMHVSASALVVRVAGLLVTGQAVVARMGRGGVTCELPAVVAWTRSADPPEPGTLVGLELRDELRRRERLLLDEMSLFDIVPAGPDGELAGGVEVILQGDLTESVDFAALAEGLRGQRRIVFDTAGVRYISSAGVKAWCDLVTGLGSAEYVFRHASVAFASQAAMVPMVLGSGRVVSLEAPYHCETCRRDDLRLLETDALLREGGHVTAPCLRCAGCGGQLEFDDVPDRYFAFLRGPGPSGEESDR